MKIIPFLPDHIEEAAHLFTSRYEILREKNPSLPGNGTEVEVIKSRLANIIQKNPAFIALESEKLVGYLSGLRMDEFKGHCQRHLYSLNGHIQLWKKTQKRFIKLYTHLWLPNGLKQGHVQQAITFLANNRRGIDFFFAYGFGMLVGGWHSFNGLIWETLAPQCQIRKATEAGYPPAVAYGNRVLRLYAKFTDFFVLRVSQFKEFGRIGWPLRTIMLGLLPKIIKPSAISLWKKMPLIKLSFYAIPSPVESCGAHVHPQYRGQGIMKALAPTRD